MKRESDYGTCICRKDCKKDIVNTNKIFWSKVAQVKEMVMYRTCSFIGLFVSTKNDWKINGYKESTFRSSWIRNFKSQD